MGGGGTGSAGVEWGWTNGLVTAGGEATFARFFRLDEAMDEFSSRRNSVNSAVLHNGGVEAAVFKLILQLRLCLVHLPVRHPAAVVRLLELA